METNSSCWIENVSIHWLHGLPQVPCVGKWKPHCCKCLIGRLGVLQTGVYNLWGRSSVGEMIVTWKGQKRMGRKEVADPQCLKSLPGERTMEGEPASTSSCV